MSWGRATCNGNVLGMQLPTNLQCALSDLFNDNLDSMGMCLCRVPNIPPVVLAEAAEPPGSTVPLGSVGSGGSSVTASLTATAVVGVIVELISCSHGVDIRQPVADRGHEHLPRSQLHARFTLNAAVGERSRTRTNWHART